MTTLIESVKNAWQAYTALMLIVGALAAFATLPSRVDALETRMASVEQWQKFAGCWMLETSAGRDPNPCRYLLENPDDFRPPFASAGQ